MQDINGTPVARKPEAPSPVASQSLDDPSLYINRELSWLAFNRRVLEEALDPNVPLMERIKFLAIFAANLDEFFMVRVGGLQQKMAAGINVGSGADRMAPRDQLAAVSQTVRDLFQAGYTCLREQLLPALEKEGIYLHLHKDGNNQQKDNLTTYFRRDIFPVLTPLAIDQGHPFPHLLNKTLNLAVLLKRPRETEKLLAVVQVPAVLPRFVHQKTDAGHVLIPLETVIRFHLADLFPGMEIEHASVFRVSRNSEYEIDDDEVEDLLKAIEEEVRRRRRGFAVRLEIEANAHPVISNYLMQALDIDASDVYPYSDLLDLTGLFQLYNLPGFPHLRDPVFVPQPANEFVSGPNVFAAIKARDILVHHPYETFSHVVDFIETAAKDERVLAIKQTLYRTSSDSPVVKALQLAADNGKQVTAVIELKARLDEERNILWSRELEKSGVHVAFGCVGVVPPVAELQRREQ